ncbi:hypothetical protein L7F22_048976 [Adiantum nelumboides]|nr:hypothetical protein [Adiantum nelumboides]
MALVVKSHLPRMQDEDGDYDMHRERSASSRMCSSSASSHARTTSHRKSRHGCAVSQNFCIQQMSPRATLSAARTLNVYGREGKMVGKIQFQMGKANGTSIFFDVKLIVISSKLTLITSSVSRSFLSNAAYFPRTPSDYTYYFLADKHLLNEAPLLKIPYNDAGRTRVQIKGKSCLCDDRLKLECLKDEVHDTRGNMHDVNLQGELGKQIYVLEIEINNLKEKLLQQTKDLKACHDQVLELKGNIRVFCRCRPLAPYEDTAGSSSVIEFSPFHNRELYVCTNDGARKTFRFDHVFSPSHSQEEVFLEIAPLVVSVLDGFNVCIFAYGQTGTGKTFTMEGSEANRGVNYRTLEKLFQLASERKGQCRYQILVSVLEVYNDEIRDLLTSSSSLGHNGKKLEIKQVADGMHHVLGAVEAPVHSIDEAWKILQTGSRARVVGSTNANKHSSRSHCLLRIMVKGENFLTGECSKSKLWLIDLAGSERIGKTDVCGERLKESQNINKSLSALGDVIHALASKNSHIPYRNSKITHLLQDSLGGQSKTVMFVQISPSENDIGETLCSLNFASRVRGIELGAPRKQLDPVEVLKYKKMIEKTREDGLRKDAINVELQAAAKVKEQTCKALAVKVKEIESLLANEKKARVTAEEKLKEHQVLIDKQRLMIEKLSAELRAKQSGVLQATTEQKIPFSLTPRRPPLQERQTENREQIAFHQTRKRAAEGYPQKENIFNEVDAGNLPLKKHARRVSLNVMQRQGFSTPTAIPLPKKRAVLQEDPREELLNLRRRGRASLCVFPQKENSLAVPVAQPPPTFKCAEPRRKLQSMCLVDGASLESRKNTLRSFMEAPQKVHLQSPHSRQPRCSQEVFLQRCVSDVNSVNVTRGKPPQHPHQAVTRELHHQPKRLLSGQNADDVGNPLMKMRRLSAATPPPQTNMCNWALPPVPSTPTPVLFGGGLQFHHMWTPSVGRLGMTPLPWTAAPVPSAASTPVRQPMHNGAQRVPSKKVDASRTLRHRGAIFGNF